MKNLCSFLIFSLCYLNTIAQTNWTNKNHFEQKSFIENKGQNDFDTLPNHQTALFTANIDGVIYFFTKSGYTIIHTERQKLSNEELDRIEASKKNENEAEERVKYKIVKKYHELKWLNSNPQVEIISENKVDNYYSYSNLKSTDKKGTIIAHAYKKIIYKNIYPNTDIQFEFPKDSTGIKYSIYLYPGADIEKIKMIFPNEKFSLNNFDDLEITSEFGNVTDHKPSSIIVNSKTKVKSNFKITDNEVGFDLGNIQIYQAVVIDPWTVTPDFGNIDKAFDIDYDNQGNVYVYGGSGY